MKLKRSEVKKLVEDVLQNIPCEDCRTCDCFLGFFTRLELDAQEDARNITDAFKVLKTQMHGCLGCHPCPPAEAYSNYIRQNLKIKRKD